MIPELRLLLAPVLLLAIGASAPARQETPEPEPWSTLTRELADGLVLTADAYTPAEPDPGEPDPGEVGGEETAAPTPIVVCLHMAGSSRGEYRPIAPELTARGLRVLAVDLRSGSRRNGVTNETAKAWSKRSGRPKAGYGEAFPDVEAAVAWARELAPGAPVVLLGSSYSASLALVYAARNPEAVDLVVALSPGEYMKDWATIAEEAAKVRTPVYVTCGNGVRERGQAEPIAAAIPAGYRTAWFPPDGIGADHGSRTLVVADPEARAEQWRRLDVALALLRAED